MPALLDIPTHIADFDASPLARWRDLAPWEFAARSAEIVLSIVNTASVGDYKVAEGMAIHKTAIVEPGAVLKAPLFMGAGCFVASGAYLRGGCWVADHCTFGPGAELKSSFVFAGTKLAHFNFVGDSLLGAGVNLEAGSTICNYRNEREDKEILVRLEAGLRRTGAYKFGALVGDRSRIGANAVIAPGALLRPGSIVRRAQLCDQED